MKTLRVILGDQLNINHSWFKKIDDNITYTLIEAHSESTYVKHHIQKIVGFFASMREFAQELKNLGHQVIYTSITDDNNLGSIPNQIQDIIKNHDFEKFEYQEPDEYRLDIDISRMCSQLSIPSEMVSSEHFLTNRYDVKEFFKKKKTYLMESFYRDMRKTHQIMMEDDKSPKGGSWNFDKENRKPFKNQVEVPTLPQFQNDISSILDDIKSQALPSIGNIDLERFNWPINRKQALSCLTHFCEQRLIYFGTYEDAMHTEHEVLFHSQLSFALNIKLLSPLEVVNTVINYWEQLEDIITINQVEGFVRQIIGWREFMRGIYWAEMPEFANMNFLEHNTKLPQWFWTGETKMNCLKQSITQSLDTAYAHHIQRLMVTGNFALLAGIHPDEIDQWYLGIYIDAIQWVEITNTRGMSQFADGGLIATKPYISSANYIDKMSNYCSDCFYNKKTKSDENSCPFNSLYWHFYERHRSKFDKNPRVGMMYRTWDKMNSEKKSELLDRAEFILDHLEEI